MKQTILAVATLFSLPVGLLGAELQRDITYARYGDREMKLDFMSPGGKMRPLLICIHGGAWRAGSKNSYHGVMKSVVEQGVAAATIQYRLTDEAIWPAQIDDVRAAHKHLVDNADKYGIDPERIAVTGGSAGGHLSLMLGLGPKETGEALRVRGIVNLFGPAELRDIEKIEHVRQIVEGLVGGKLEDKSKALAASSPVTVVDRTDPPVLTFHGTDDKTVPYEQATILHDALEKAQVPNRLFTMKDTAHGLGDYRDQVMRQLGTFIKNHLQGSTDLPLVAHEDFDEESRRWRPTEDAAWKSTTKDGRSYFSLIKKKSDYTPKVRSPHNIALLSDVDVSDFGAGRRPSLDQRAVWSSELVSVLRAPGPIAFLLRSFRQKS